MPMLSDPSQKYRPYPAVPFPDNYARKWPTQRATSSPTWLSTDLRDGNQALVNPMSNSVKLELFKLLVKIGFKEIEVAYPSASEPEFQFVRSLIDNNEVPDDVSLQIITPARSDLITKSIASLAGAKHAIIHLYNAVSPVFREVVFRKTKEETTQLTLDAVRLVRQLTDEESSRSGTRFTLNYCLETFSQTEPEFAVELANKVLKEWGSATPENKIIFNLPATVESAPSNHYADLVEYFATHINHRDCVILSVHPHNDRGTAVAAAELGLLAGGERVEGCLLGNGERTGNVDLITLALNLYSQGISPKLDFSNLSQITEKVCRCNEAVVPHRYPYAGKLVFSAFAGTHQDAIKKGLDAQAKRWAEVDRTGQGMKYWAMPYIPIDPKDLGFGYENLIRVSSQSGKAGTAHVVKEALGFDLPRRMQGSFYSLVQKESERTGKEMTALLISEMFKRSYGLDVDAGQQRIALQSFDIVQLSPSTSSDSQNSSEESLTSVSSSSMSHFTGRLIIDGKARTIEGKGLDALFAILDAFRKDLNMALTAGELVTQFIESSSNFVSYFEVQSPDTTPVKSVWGVGMSPDMLTSKYHALVSAVNELMGSRPLPRPKLVFTPRPSFSPHRTTSWVGDVRLRAGRSPLPTPDPERTDFLPLEART